MSQDDLRRDPDVVAPTREPERVGPWGEPVHDARGRHDGYQPAPPTADPAALDDRALGSPVGEFDEFDEPVDGDDTDRAPVRLVIRDRRRFLGMLAAVLAALLFVANIVGIVLSNSGSNVAALNIAYVTIFGTMVTFVGGVLAAALNFGRAWGVAAVVLSVLANPFVLVVLLGSFSGALR